MPELIRPASSRADASRAPGSVGATALALGVFFLSLYLLTMAGHTSSSDEELYFYITERLAGRTAGRSGTNAELIGGRSVDLVESSALVWPGIVHEVLAVPFYLAGDAAAHWLPPNYHDYLTRLFVGMLDPVASALTCVVLFLFGLELGYSRRVARLLALAYGLTTLAWPYSKYFWRDPMLGFWLLLAAYLAVVGLRRKGLWAPIPAGLAAGLAVGTKIAALVAVSGLAVYFVGARWRAGARTHPPSVVGLFALAFVLAVLLVVLGYFARFGVPLEADAFVLELADLLWAIVDPTRYGGVLGLLFSPGKSIALFAPICLVSIPGARLLWVRRPYETGLLIFLVVGQVLAHGRLDVWHGDESWGPRYLVAAAPLMVLPAGAALCWSAGRARRLTWWTFLGLSALGLLVESGGVLVNYLVYTSRLGGTTGPLADERRWSPARSPILGQWQVFGERLQAVASWQAPELYLERGFFWSEDPEPELLPRWTGGDALLVFPGAANHLDLVLTFVDYRPPDVTPAQVAVGTAGGRAATVAFHLDATREPRVLTVSVDAPSASSEPLRLALHSDTWIPASTAQSGDRRQLGIHLLTATAEADGRPVSIGTALVPPLPWSNGPVWSKESFFWFITPRTQLLDLWWWHLYFSGLPRRLLLIALLPGLGLVCSGLALLWPAIPGRVIRAARIGRTRSRVGGMQAGSESAG